MRAFLAWSIGMVVAVAACEDKPDPYYYKPGDGGEGGGGLGLGVGEPCEEDGECRPGLVCASNTLTCQPGGTLGEGDECVISAECQDGLYCEFGVCAPAGDGGEGDDCLSDADCIKGMTCVLDGLSASCMPSTGTVDVGGACTATSECFAPLDCIDGTCQPPTPGAPFGAPWQGVDCPEETGPAVAYHHIPRNDASDADFFRLPFPSDVRRSTSGTLDLSGFPTPGDALLGYDLVQRYVDAIVASRDGWGMYSNVIFRFSAALDTDSMQDDVHLVDLTTSTAVGLYWHYAQGRSNYVCHNRVAIRRPDGRTFEPGHTYAAYFTTGIIDENGDPIERADDLVALLGSQAPSDPAVAAHWDKYASFRQWLSDNSVDPTTVLNVSVFTIGTPRALVEQLDAVISAAPPTASQWTLCDTGVISPCPDATGDRGCQAADPAFHELHARVSLPIFQQGTAPYLDSGGAFASAAGVPSVVRQESVCLSLTIPKDVMPVGGWDTVVHGHGTGGHFRSHIVDGSAAELAQGIDDGQGTTIKVASIGIDQVQHGPRRNGSDETPNDLYFNFENPDAALGNPQQAAADQIALYRFVPTVSFPVSGPTGEAFNLSGDVAHWGHSQGASAGSIAIAYGNWAGAVFSGQGGGLRDALVAKSSPVNIAGMLPFVLQDATSDGSLAQGAQHPVLQLMQTHSDGGDPVSYAQLAALTPPASLAARHVFQVYGLADTYSPSQVQRNFAIGVGADVVTHDASVSTPEDIAGKVEVAPPASGNHDINSKTVSVYVRQYASSGDGHFVIADVASARADALRFLAGCLTGVVPQVGQ